VRQLAERGDARRLGDADATYLSLETRWPEDRVRREWDAVATPAR
jgi:hypothetical protein